MGGSTVFETAAVAEHRPKVGRACPSVRSCGGRNRTCEGALNRRLPVPTQAPPQKEVKVAGFEHGTDATRWSSQVPPTMSTWRPARCQAWLHSETSRCGRICTADLVLPKHALFPGYPTHRNQSAQRESNPHIRHGKADRLASCQSVPSAATSWAHRIADRIVKEHRAPDHGCAAAPGLEPTSPPTTASPRRPGCGILAAGRPVLFFS